MLSAYKYRIYPKKTQRERLAKHFGCSRWVYNWALDTTKKYYEKHKKQISRTALQKELVALKQTDAFSWLKEVNSQALLSSILHLYKAYKGFFRKTSKFPKFKKKHNRQSFACPQHVSLDIDQSRLHLPKIKNIKIKLHRFFEGEIRTVTLSQTPSGKYFASILVSTQRKAVKADPLDPAQTMGLDLGLTHFAITSEGEKVDNPKFLKRNLKRLSLLQKALSRKKKGSYNYKKKRRAVAIQHEKIASRRYDFIQQYTGGLMRESQATSFAVEDLHVKGMIKNRKLSRCTRDASWGTFLRCLEYKSLWYGKNVFKIGRFVASSKTCHMCGLKQEKLPLSIREWRCSCGVVHDRDINAAKMIRGQAIADAPPQSVCVKSSSTEVPSSKGAVARG